MQSRIQVDTDIVFVMSTGAKTVLLLDWKTRKDSPISCRYEYGWRCRPSISWHGSGREALEGVDLDFVEIGSTSAVARCWTLGAWKQLFHPPDSRLC